MELGSIKIKFDDLDDLIEKEQEDLKKSLMPEQFAPPKKKKTPAATPLNISYDQNDIVQQLSYAQDGKKDLNQTLALGGDQMGKLRTFEDELNETMTSAR